MKTVDILMPIYRPKKEHLLAALESVLGQTEQNWKLLISEDASVPETKTILEPFLDDPRITFHAQGRRLGIGENWNACLRASSADLVAFLFQDDVWEPMYLESARHIFERHSTAVIASFDHVYHFEDKLTEAMQTWYEKVRVSRQAFVEGAQSGREILKTFIGMGLKPNIIGEPSFVALRRSVIEKVGYFLEDMPQCLDTEYWVRVLRQGDWYNANDKSYGAFRVHSSAASAQNFAGGVGAADRLRCMEIALRDADPDERGYIREALVEAIAQMVYTWRSRSGNSKKTSNSATSFILAFAMRHPVVMVRGVVKGIGKEK